MEETIITFDLLDVTAKADSVPSADDAQPFVDINQLKQDSLSVPKYATLEDDFFLLDGSFQPFPDSPAGMDFGYWSEFQSGADGNFATNPLLTIEFTEKHTSAGITLTFQEDYPDSIIAKWYTLAGVLINTKPFHPDSFYYFCDNAITDYGKIEIEFIHTAKPYRYIKLTAIDYGVIKDFEGNAVTNAVVTEEVNPISSEITINTTDFSLHSDNGDFDLINTQGMYKLFQQSQQLHLKKWDDIGITQMGTFYLDTWKSADANNGVFHAIDSVGQIDKTQFKKGRIYVDELAGNIVDDIMESAGVTKYTMSDTLRAVPLSGWIPICTHRAALQQVAFALGAIVDDSRSDTISIYKGTQSYGHLVSRSRKFSGGTTDLLSYVSDVNLTAHSYTAGASAEQISQGTYLPGIYEIQFSTAVAELAATGATITEVHPNYAIITVDTAGSVTLTGKKYTNNKMVYTRGIDKLPSGAVRNPISCDGATLISASNVSDIAQGLYEYYQLRYSTGTEIILESERSGEKIALQQANGTAYTMETIEKMVVDLVGGYTAQISTLGNGMNIVYSDYLNEKYVGEDMGVI